MKPTVFAQLIEVAAELVNPVNVSSALDLDNNGGAVGIAAEEINGDQSESGTPAESIPSPCRELPHALR